MGTSDVGGPGWLGTSDVGDRDNWELNGRVEVTRLVGSRDGGHPPNSPFSSSQVCLPKYTPRPRLERRVAQVYDFCLTLRQSETVLVSGLLSHSCKVCLVSYGSLRLQHRRLGQVSFSLVVKSLTCSRGKSQGGLGLRRTSTDPSRHLRRSRPLPVSTSGEWELRERLIDPDFLLCDPWGPSVRAQEIRGRSPEGTIFLRSDELCPWGFCMYNLSTSIKEFSTGVPRHLYRRDL